METLDKHFRELTKAAFARYGFAHAELLGRWPEIAGAGLAQHCRPDRIKWPRGAGESAQKQGGTLVIRAAPGRALDLQYEAPGIMERVNRYYGYGAVTAIKVVQGSHAQGRDPPVPAPSPPAVQVQLDGIAQDPLKTALERLGAGVAAGRTASPVK